MFKALLSVALLPFVAVSFATGQANEPDTAYPAAVREFISSTMHLTDSTQYFLLEDSVDKRGTSLFLTECLEDTATFTPSEREQIGRWASRPFFSIWTKSMAPGARMIPTDTINAIFSRDDTDGWEYFYHRYGYGLNNFGCPLFLHNYTWCLFYSGYSCGWACGWGQLALYKKEDGRWVFVKKWGEWKS